LSAEEREDILRRIRERLAPDGEPPRPEAPGVDAEREYARLPWHARLGLFLLSLFTSRTPAALYRDRELARLGRTIASQAPGMYDFSRNMLLSGFYRELAGLRESARFFCGALGALAGQGRRAFYGLLGSLEMGNIHARLLAETDPRALEEANPGARPPELRRIAVQGIEESVNLASEEQRRAMQEGARYAQSLERLAAFPFGQTALQFFPDRGGAACFAPAVKDALRHLNDTLFSLRQSPPPSLFEALFVFALQDRAEEPGFDPGEEARKLLDGAERSLGVVKQFGRATLLTPTLRCVFRDLSLSPAEAGGGEDWLAAYREHWEALFDGRLERSLRAARFRALRESLLLFFKGGSLQELQHAASERNPGGVPLRETAALRLSFLKTYRATVFARDNEAALRAVRFNGKFRSRESQFDFSSSYDELRNLDDAVGGLERQLSPAGAFGLRHAAALRGAASPPRRRRAREVAEEASLAADRIAERSALALAGLADALQGIANKETNGLPSLINLREVAGKGTGFMDRLSAAAEHARAALGILNEIEGLERRNETGA
jgi:hypothetical protein